MHKSEVGFYGIFMNGGNPCFVYNDGRVSKHTIIDPLVLNWEVLNLYTTYLNMQ